MLIWSTAPLCWMVISFSVGELFGNIFLNNAILGLVEVLATFMSMSIQKYLPRQILMFLCFLFLGIFLLTSTVLRGFYYDKTRVADVVVMILAKFFASSKFFTEFFRWINILACIAITYLLSSEVFPTVCRSTAIGFSSTPGRVINVIYRSKSSMCSMFQWKLYKFYNFVKLCHASGPRSTAMDLTTVHGNSRY